MEVEGKVSVWIGRFIDQDSLDKYVDLSYDEKGESVISQFYLDYDIDIDEIDEYLVEKSRFSVSINNLKEMLSNASYIENFVEKLPEFVTKPNFYNSVILVYNFEYSSINIEHEDVLFVGAFDY